MSYELDYFPPKPFNSNGWSSKTLNYSPWRKSLYLGSPAQISLEVDLFDGVYKWVVNVTDWNYKHTRYVGRAKTAKEACQKAEDMGETQLYVLTPDWIKTALQHKWRPPFIEGNRSGYLGVAVEIIEMD
jgi:hypothetical protein